MRRPLLLASASVAIASTLSSLSRRDGEQGREEVQLCSATSRQPVVVHSSEPARREHVTTGAAPDTGQVPDRVTVHGAP